MSDTATISGSKKGIKPTDSCDINVNPNKRMHSEKNMIESLKMALTEEFDTARSSFVLNATAATQLALAQKETELPLTEEKSSTMNSNRPPFIPDDDDAADAEEVEEILTGEPNSEVAFTDDSAGPPIEQEPENASSFAEEEPCPLVEKRPRSASPDPVPGEETRPPKKAATTSCPSPTPASSQAASSSASQRLAGPSSTPARVQQILSTNTSGTSRGVQMVLDTTSASSNLKPGHEGPHLTHVYASGRSSEMGVDEEVGDKPSPWTDVVDEAVAVDRPDSEVQAPKSKPKQKQKARARASKRVDDAGPTSSLELHDSSSASVAPSKTAAATASSSRDAVSGIQTEVAHTPLPNPECDPPRASMPEPEGSHWIFTPLIQSVIRQKTIPFYFRNTHESSEKSLQMYARSTGRTIPEEHRTVTPNEGEVILGVYKRNVCNQISVHPRFLVPWEPVVKDDVVVIKGLLFGAVGVVKAEEHPRWVVTFSADNYSWDFRFEESDLAVLEDL